MVGNEFHDLVLSTGAGLYAGARSWLSTRGQFLRGRPCGNVNILDPVLASVCGRIDPGSFELDKLRLLGNIERP